MTTVALYARVLSKNQAQNNTIESQIVELKRRISVDGHELLKEYIFTDDGRSGSNLEREGLKELLRKVGEGKINKIYIYSLDQLSRNSAQQIALIDEFEKAGVEIIFLSHKVENDPDSKLLSRMKGLLSKPETITTMERSGRRKRHRASCIRVIGTEPFGYDRKEHVDRDQIKFEINKEEAKIVRQIFVWIGQERVSIREVICRLRDRSVRTRAGNRIWRPIVIWKMLRNPAYKGLFAFGKSKRVEKRGKITICRTNEENWICIPVPKIVDEELFNKVQKQLNQQRAVKSVTKAVDVPTTAKKELLEAD